MKNVFQPIILLFLATTLNAQVVINEVSSKNKTELTDQFGDSPDWIELYNTSTSPLDLSSYYLSTDKANLSMWNFGEVTIDSSEHLLVLASERDLPFKTTIEKTTNGMGNNFYTYADIDDQNPGKTTVAPLLYKGFQGLEQGNIAYSAHFNVGDNTGPGELGFNYGGLHIIQGNWGQINDFTDFNVLSVNASITAGRTMLVRIVQDGLSSWLGYGIEITGNGSDSTYTIPLFQNGNNLDLSKITAIQFEITADPGITDLKVTSINWESRSTIEAISSKNFFYTDADQTPPGGSTITPFAFPGISSLQNGRNALSATINYANNTGGLGFSYATIRNQVFNWNDSLDLSAYDFLEVHANIQANRNIRVALYQKGTQDFNSYGLTLQGNGQDSLYKIPLTGNVSPLDLTQITAIAVEGIQPYGPTSFTINYMDFTKKIGRGEGHSNFNLSADGETIYFSDGILILDSIQTPIDADHLSYGRNGDGNSNWVLFSPATPGSTNNSTVFNGYCNDSIFFSSPSGLYVNSISLVLSGSSEIHYTIDGSTPTITSPLYTSPLTLDSTIVVRAGCFSGTTLPTTVFTNTYIIGKNTTLPVFSISTDPDNLFDHNTGILAEGPGWTPDLPHFGANFWEDWTRTAYMEFFDENGVKQLEQGINIKVFGGWSRANEQKSLKITADKEYGVGRFNYRFFNHKNIDSFKSLVLRNSGNDFNQEHFHDAINQTNLRSINHHIDYQEFMPAVVYLNGQYWGIMNLREKINEEFIQDNYGLKEKHIEVYDTWGQPLHNGDLNNLTDIFDDITSKDLSIDANFNSIEKYFDMQNLIDYFSVNIYASNWDWPQNNLKFWRPIKDTIGAIRYIMFDTDITLGKFGIQDADFNQINRLLTDNNIGYHAQIFSALTDNIGFRNQFLTRSADLMNTILNETNYNITIDSLKAHMASEMPDHSLRWNRFFLWDDAIQESRDFLALRDAFAWDQMKTAFALPNIHTITITNNDITAGEIQINTIEVPDSPWSGDYFETVPVTLIPHPFHGFSFSHWQTANGDVFSDTLVVNLTKNEAVTAFFTGSAKTIELTISEINYKSDINLDYGDYFEITNLSSDRVDLSGFSFRDSEDFHNFSFPSGTSLDPNGILVVAQNPIKLTALAPLPLTSIGGFDFGLGSKSDQIRVYDNFGSLILETSYSNALPWPDAGGTGFTLENPTLSTDINSSTTWITGCYGGSPGIPYSSSCPVGIETISEKQHLTLYPNPTKTNITISGINGKSNYTIFNATGNIIDKGMLNDNDQLQINTLLEGVYFIRLNSEGTNTILPFMKTN